MVLRDRIAVVVRWPGWTGLTNWRRYAPAAGSVVTHIVLAAVFVSFLAASGGERMPLKPAPPMLEITLVAETPTAPIRPLAPGPPPRPTQPRASDPSPEAPPVAKNQNQ
jgi:hypothetical protein